MLSSLQIKNFKSIYNSEPISFSRFSVLCGSNSSGKSSLIQTLLMLSQTFSSRFSQGSMALNGNLVRLGSFEDIRSTDFKKEDISIKIELNISPSANIFRTNLEKAIFEFTFGIKKSNNISPEEELHPEILKSNITLMKSDGTIDSLHLDQPSQNETPPQAHDLYNVKSISFSDYESTQKQYPDFKIIGCKKDSFLPYSIKIEYDHTKKISAQVVEFLIGRDVRRSRYFGASKLDESDISLPRSFFQKIKALIEKERSDLEKSIEIPEELRALIKNEQGTTRSFTIELVKNKLIEMKFDLQPSVIGDKFLDESLTPISEWQEFVSSLDPKQKKHLVEFIDKNRSILQEAWYHGVKKDRRIETIDLRSFQDAAYLIGYYFERSIKYLGPLRNEPLPIYPALGLTDPTNVGLKGEYTAAVLHINKSRSLKYPSPKIDSNGKLSFSLKRSTLDEACIDWLSYLGVAQKVQTNDQGKLGYGLSVKTHTNDKWQDLTHVGVGVSQVLPIVLMSLLSDEDEVLIFEQPELHLHPKVQSRLCDFFVAISQWGRQCLIETHSEYLINRLRLRIVQSNEEDLKNSSSIWFLSKPSEITNFEKICINEFGAITNWPEEFFDQTDKEVESILIEATKKRKLHKKNANSLISDN